MTHFIYLSKNYAYEIGYQTRHRFGHSKIAGI